MTVESSINCSILQCRSQRWLISAILIFLLSSIGTPAYTAPWQQGSTQESLGNQRNTNRGQINMTNSGYDQTELYAQSRTHQARQPTQRILVFLVEGNQDCCIASATDLIRSLENLQYPGVEIIFAGLDARNLGSSSSSFKDYTLSWNSVRNRHEHGFDIGNNILRGTENFEKQAREYIDEQPSNTSLIFIGHSFGGDSILTFVSSYVARHNILFVGVIDPVDGLGIRATTKTKTIPSNVDYFFNRWQTNTLWPQDFLISGKVPCNAQKCDQKEQSESRKPDGSADRVRCGDLEVGCVGAKMTTEKKCGTLGCINVPVWYPGTKNKPVSHQTLAYDPYVQKQIVDIISRLIEQNVVANAGLGGCQTELLDVYVSIDASADGNGSDSYPINTIGAGVDCAADNGTIWIGEGSYNETLHIDHPVTLRSSGGTVVIGLSE